MMLLNAFPLEFGGALGAGSPDVSMRRFRLRQEALERLYDRQLGARLLPIGGRQWIRLNDDLPAPKRRRWQPQA